MHSIADGELGIAYPVGHLSSTMGMVGIIHHGKDVIYARLKSHAAIPIRPLIRRSCSTYAPHQLHITGDHGVGSNSRDRSCREPYRSWPWVFLNDSDGDRWKTYRISVLSRKIQDCFASSILRRPATGWTIRRATAPGCVKGGDKTGMSGRDSPLEVAQEERPLRRTRTQWQTTIP